ncbi:MAG: VanW family protein [Lachnospiraceae bacterium]|nr:VanW family protein [Lachnospiraceae bacterium]
MTDRKKGKISAGRRLSISLMMMGLVTAGSLSFGFTSEAKNKDTVEQGVYADTVSLGGMTTQEATQAVKDYIEELKSEPITLHITDETDVDVTAGDLGITWSNPELVEEAIEIGKSGNIVARYKALKDLEHSDKVLDVALTCDVAAVTDLLASLSEEYNVEAVNAHLVRNNGAFEMEGGQIGCVIDETASAKAIQDFVANTWAIDNSTVTLAVTVDEPKGSEEELKKVKDVLGTYTTSFKSSGADRSANVTNGCNLINGATIYPGDTFSVYEAVSPFSTENGYYLAGSYLNGQVVDSLGGGICQVSTTLYNAVLLSELEVTERHNHSMIVSYVKPSMDAAIAESSGKDFQFVNNTDAPIYIEGYTEDKQITFTIYGQETRDTASRKVTYESETLETTVPDTETIFTDANQPIGYVATQGVHIGYKARLWKVVTVNGVQESREQVNSSSYKAVPRQATFGVATADPNAYNTMAAALATNNIDYIKGVAAALAAGQPVVVQPPAPAVDPATGQPATTDPAAGQPGAAVPGTPAADPETVQVTQ